LSCYSYSTKPSKLIMKTGV